MTKLGQLPGYSAENESDTVDLCYFGAVYELRRPTELLLAAKALLNEGYPGSDRLRLRFTGGWIVTNGECNGLADELTQLGIVVRNRGIPHEEYLKSLKSSQFLLVLQQGFPLQIPAKIYEYMASGRPMIMIGGEGATASLIEQTGAGRVCPNTVDSIKNLLKDLIGNGDSIERPKPSVIERYSYKALSQKLTHCFDAAIRRHATHKPGS